MLAPRQCWQNTSQQGSEKNMAGRHLLQLETPGIECHRDNKSRNIEHESIKFSWINQSTFSRQIRETFQIRWENFYIPGPQPTSVSFATVPWSMLLCLHQETMVRPPGFRISSNHCPTNPRIRSWASFTSGVSSWIEWESSLWWAPLGKLIAIKPLLKKFTEATFWARDRKSVV